MAARRVKAKLQSLEENVNAILRKSTGRSLNQKVVNIKIPLRAQCKAQIGVAVYHNARLRVK